MVKIATVRAIDRLQFLTFRFGLVWKCAAGLLSLKETDIWFPSFPKAGSTWVRFFYFNLCRLAAGETDTTNLIQTDDVMPALGHKSATTAWPFPAMPRLIKTHQPYRPLLFRVPDKVLYMIRDPRDIMVSYYHYLSASLWRPYTATFSDFIRHPRFGIEACIKHYQSWQPYITVLLKYEDLKDDPLAEFSRAIRQLDISVSREHILLANQRSSFNNMMQVENAIGISGPKRFETAFKAVRKGTANQWVSFFSPQDIAYSQDVAQRRCFDLYDFATAPEAE